MPFNMGPAEVLLIFLLIIILFGAKRLPELARSMGRSIKEFKNATQGLRDEFDMDKIDERPRNSSAPPQSDSSQQEKQSQSSSKSSDGSSSQ